ncbi:hypothetical protein [Moorena sp. SIO2C4]|uniref:hypothetical protein n=1 Tax=Moorena sp. SIO2C4 TaxID=2607824 RepID=UPI0013BED0DC|nr:hypothetical protein [Moorena sp. SIO2C4]NEQ14972.1 hypothetical protein [Moorena sp. SIO3E2]NES45625.1 hypothetical protein [Moorena sp. SIO2C4]
MIVYHSLLPTPYSLLPTPYSLKPRTKVLTQLKTAVSYRVNHFYRFRSNEEK